MSKKTIGIIVIVVGLLITGTLTFIDDYNGYNWPFLLTAGPGSLLLGFGWMIKDYDKFMAKYEKEKREKTQK